MARKPKLGLPLQTLRNAPDALEGRRLRGGVFEIEPDHVETVGRLDDRLQIEIAGLKAAEILAVDDIPCMMLQINANRGLKNLTSARLVPLHPQLLEMGLVAWAQDRMLRDGPRADLFPDMRPQKLPPIEQATGDEEGGKFGDQINYRFNKLVDRQITTQRAERGACEGDCIQRQREVVWIAHIDALESIQRPDQVGQTGNVDRTHKQVTKRTA